MNDILLSSAYLAPIEYFQELAHCNTAWIEQHDHYTKQTYRNRCNIASPNGILSLSVPIIKPEKGKNEMKDILISEHGNWQHLHWNAIESAYNNSPFFEYYKDDFIEFYTQKQKYLYDLNNSLLEIVCGLLDLSPEIKSTTSYFQSSDISIKDLRDKIHPKTRIKDELQESKIKPYYQVFDQKHGFIPNLSIIDLLFNMGPESVLYL